MDRFVFRQCLTVYLPEKVVSVVDAYYPTDVLVMMSDGMMHVYKDELWTAYELKHYSTNTIIGGDSLYIPWSGCIYHANLITQHLDYIPCDRSSYGLVYTDTIWCIGGWSRFTSEISSTILRWNNGWDHVGDLKLGRDNCTCVVYNDELYIIGGYNSNQWLNYYLNSVEVFNVTTKHTRGIASMRYARSDPQVVVYNHKIYVVGGYTAWGFKANVPVTEAEMYNLSTNKWELSDIPFPKTECRLVVVKDVLYCCDTHEVKMYHPVYSWIPISLPSPRPKNISLHCINEQYLPHTPLPLISSHISIVD